MTVKDIRDRVRMDTVILIHDRKSEEGTVYHGTELNMRTFWDDRQVVWIKPYDQELFLEIE